MKGIITLTDEQILMLAENSLVHTIEFYEKRIKQVSEWQKEELTKDLEITKTRRKEVREALQNS